MRYLTVSRHQLRLPCLCDQPVRRVEFWQACSLACNPSKHVDLYWIGERVRDVVEDHFKKRVRTQIFKVVNVGLHSYALVASDRLPVFLMKCQLDVCFSEANLLEARGGVTVEKLRINFRGKHLFRSSRFDFVHQLGNGVAKESILGQCIPLDASEIIQWCAVL